MHEVIIRCGDTESAGENLEAWVPGHLMELAKGSGQRSIPAIARDAETTARIGRLLSEVPTTHQIRLGDSREAIRELPEESVHLAITSPPYWTLKEYEAHPDQLGHVDDYEEFLDAIDIVWEGVRRALVPGGRLVVVVGDVCLSRRKLGRHVVVPLHASIQERCRAIGFDNLAPIIWHKIANASLEVANGSSFLGKPYEPNSVVKNDIEFILSQRKPGGYGRHSMFLKLAESAPSIDSQGSADKRYLFRGNHAPQQWGERPKLSTQAKGESLHRQCNPAHLGWESSAHRLGLSDMHSGIEKAFPRIPPWLVHYSERAASIVLVQGVH